MSPQPDTRQTWTAIQTNGPNHLGLRSNGLSSKPTARNYLGLRGCRRPPPSSVPPPSMMSMSPPAQGPGTGAPSTCHLIAEHMSSHHRTRVIPSPNTCHLIVEHVSSHHCCRPSHSTAPAEEYCLPKTWPRMSRPKKLPHMPHQRDEMQVELHHLFSPAYSPGA